MFTKEDSEKTEPIIFICGASQVSSTNLKRLVNWRQHSQQKTGKSPGKKTPWSPFREYFENNILCKETKI